MPRDVDAYRRSYRSAQTAAAGGSEQLAKLKALGYLGGNEPSSSTSTRTAGSWSNEGLILRDEGRADDAIAAFAQALKVDPNHAATKWNLSRSLLLRGKDALKRNDCAAALEDFARAAELAPDDALAFASRGTAQLCLGDERAAQASFRRSLDIDPNQPLH
jgi:Flp pilus assembly protein TadD